jgi:hypothetical protein
MFHELNVPPVENIDRQGLFLQQTHSVLIGED